MRRSRAAIGLGWRSWGLALLLLIGLAGHRALWAAEFPVATIQELTAALATAASNEQADTILLAPGQYLIESPLRYDTFEDASLTIQGSGETVLDGQGQRVLFLRTQGSNADITIRDCTLQNGYVPEGDNGAGLFVNIAQANLVVERVRILNNYAAAFFFSNDGGGAFITAGLGANVEIRNCVVAGNGAKGHGGGLYLNLISGQLTFVHNTVVDNFNRASIPEQGGGIYLRLFYSDASALLANNILWGNTYAHGPGDLAIDDQGYDGGAALVQLRNNDMGRLDIVLATNTTEQGRQDTDPLLDSSYLLTALSPVIDSGLYGQATDDIEGDARPGPASCAGLDRPDLGADEFRDSPTVQTGMVGAITSSTATCAGAVVAEGRYPVLERGCCVNSGATPVAEASCTAAGAGQGSFIVALDGLQEGTVHAVRAYGRTCQTTVHGSVATFIPTRLPTVLSGERLNRGGYQVQGTVVGSGDGTILRRGTCWGQGEFPDLSGTCTEDGQGTGAFVSVLEGLASGQRYWYRAYATNELGVAYGASRSLVAGPRLTWPLFLPALQGAATRRR
jgi:hypothetical protein